MRSLVRLLMPRPEPANPLLDPVKVFDRRVRLALRNAATSSTLYVATWTGCPLNRAGDVLGEDVHDVRSAADAFCASEEAVFTFIHAWDSTRGPGPRRAELLVRAIDESLLADAVDDVLPEWPPPSKRPCGVTTSGVPVA